MYKNALTMLLIFLSLSASAYYGRHATEANLKFDGRIELPLYDLRTIQDIKGDPALRREVDEYIYEQVQYLMGIYNSESFMEQTGGKAATISDDIDPYKYVKIEEGKNGDPILHYTFSGKVLVNKGYFGKKGTKMKGKIPVTLPLNYETIYELGVKRIKVPVDEYKPKGKKEWAYFNLCTDDHYNSEGDFFYFWDPNRINKTGRGWSYPDCPLKNDNYNVVRVEGELTRIKNSYQKYLEYDRLYGKKKLKVSLFVGYVNDEDIGVNHFDDEDPAIEAVDIIIERMQELGYEIKEEQIHKRTDYKSKFSLPGINKYFKLEAKDVSRAAVTKKELGKDNKIDIEVEILLSDTSLNSKDRTFHRLYRRALKKSDVVVYDGHSGLGATLDLDILDMGLAGASKYQVFYFNGCSSYRYFKDSYLEKKAGGEKNLDIVLSGITTLSDTAAPNILAFVEGFLEGKALNSSYILQKIENANFDINGSYLTGILGEAQNKWEPVKK